jgi:hypothetical protein
MKQKFMKYLWVALLSGIVLTGLTLTSRKDLISVQNCYDVRLRFEAVERVFCSTWEYGLPFSYTKTKPLVSVAGGTQATPETVFKSPVFVGVTSGIDINIGKLLGNIVIWSTLSMGVFLLIDRLKRAK